MAEDNIISGENKKEVEKLIKKNIKLVEEGTEAIENAYKESANKTNKEFLKEFVRNEEGGGNYLALAKKEKELKENPPEIIKDYEAGKEYKTKAGRKFKIVDFIPGGASVQLEGSTIYNELDWDQFEDMAEKPEKKKEKRKNMRKKYKELGSINDFVNDKGIEISEAPASEPSVSDATVPEAEKDHSEKIAAEKAAKEKKRLLSNESYAEKLKRGKLKRMENEKDRISAGKTDIESYLIDMEKYIKENRKKWEKLSDTEKKKIVDEIKSGNEEIFGNYWGRVKLDEEKKSVENFKRKKSDKIDRHGDKKEIEEYLINIGDYIKNNKARWNELSEEERKKITEKIGKANEELLNKYTGNSRENKDKEKPEKEKTGNRIKKINRIKIVEKPQEEEEKPSSKHPYLEEEWEEIGREKEKEEKINKDEDKMNKETVQKEEMAETEEKLSETAPETSKLPEMPEKNNKTAENLEMSIEASKRNTDNIEYLRKELEEARNNYAVADYKITGTISQLKRFFGKFLKTDQESLSDLKDLKGRHKNKAQELLKAELDRMKTMKDFNPEKVSELILELNLDENIKLWEARTNARIGDFGEKGAEIMEKGAKFINWYRKLDWRAKIAVSSLFLGAGAGAVFAGSAGTVSAIAALGVGRKFLGGIAVGMGVKTGMEAKYRMKEEKAAKEKTKNILEDLEVAHNTPEEKYDFLMSKLSQETEEYGQKLEEEKLQYFRRTFFGWIAGIGAGFVLPEMSKWGLENSEKIVENISNFKIGETLHNVFHASDHFKDSDYFAGSGKSEGGYYTGINPKGQELWEKYSSNNYPSNKLDNNWPQENMSQESELSVDKETPKVSEASKPSAPSKSPEPQLFQESVESQETSEPKQTGEAQEVSQKAAESASERTSETLTVEKGSSLEKTIIDHFKAHPEMEKQYEDMFGGRDFDLGQIAHRLALDYATEHREEFPNGLEHHIIQPGAQIEINPHAMQISGIHHAEETIDSASQTVTESPKAAGENIEENATPEKEPAISENEATAPKTAVPDVGGNVEGGNEKVPQNLDSVLADSRLLFPQMAGMAGVVSLKGAAEMARKEISSGNLEIWRKLKDKTFSEAKKNKYVKNNLAKFAKRAFEILGKRAKPKRGENISKWTGRIAELAVKK